MPSNAFIAGLRRRFTPGQYFGLQLSLGVLAFIFSASLFGWLAEDVSSGEPITQLDASIAMWWARHQTPVIRELMVFVSWFHTWPIAAISLVFLAYLLWARNWMWAIVGATAVAGGVSLNTALKLAFHRERPTYSGLAAALNTYSFPSGHTLAAMVIYAVFAAYAISKVRSRNLRTLIALGACSVVSLVAFSRIYLGVHYLSDVVAGLAEGIAWFALCYTATTTLFARWRRKRQQISTA